MWLLFLYHGSISISILAIQYTNLSGYHVFITTCSPYNFNLMRGLGTDIVSDYNNPGSAAQIYKPTNNSLKLALDCMTFSSSVDFSGRTFSTEGGEYLSPLSVKIDCANDNSLFLLAYTTLGEAFNFGDLSFLAKPEDFEHVKKFTQVAQGLLNQGKIKAYPPNIGKDGLRGALEGIELLGPTKSVGRD